MRLQVASKPKGSAKHLCFDIAGPIAICLMTCFFTACQEKSLLSRTMKVIGGEMFQVTIGGGYQPDWSDVTNKILYISQGKIYSIAPDGTDKQLVVDLPENSALPRWQPGRDSFAFVHKGNEIWYYDGSTGKSYMVAREQFVITGLTWSSDGAWIVFACEGEGRGIEYVSLDGSQVEAVTNTLGWGRLLDVRTFHTTSDLAFVEFRDNVYNLWRIPLSGGTPKPITHYGAEELIGSVMGRATPSYDDTKIAVLSSQEHPDYSIMLHLMPASGGDLVQLIDLGAGIPDNPAWSPDSRKIALDLTNIATEVWVLTLR